MLSLKTIYSSIFFGFLLVVYFSIFSSFGKKPDAWVEKKTEWVGRCGTETRLSLNHDQNKPIKKIALVVTLTKADYDNNCRTWDTYQRVSKIALEKFLETDHTYSPEFVYLNEVSEMDALYISIEKIKKAKELDALVVVGNPWSTLAAMDSDQANLSQIAYISPTAVVSRVHDSEWSISLGVDVRKSAKGFPGFLQKIKRDRVLILESKENLQEREYASAVRNEVKDTATIQFYEVVSIEKVEEELKNHPNSVLFIPGYTHSRHIISKLFKNFPNVVFIVGPQWTHDYTPLVQEFQDAFGLKLYSFSDFYAAERPAAQFLHDAWTKSGGYPHEGGFRFSLFDAITLSLHALDNPNVTTRDQAISAIKNFGRHPYSAKSPIEIQDGKVKKPIYICKWEQDRFVKFDEFIP